MKKTLKDFFEIINNPNKSKQHERKIYKFY